MTDQKDAIAVAIKWLAAAVICHALATSPLVTLAVGSMLMPEVSTARPGTPEGHMAYVEQERASTLFPLAVLACIVVVFGLLLYGGGVLIMKRRQPHSLSQSLPPSISTDQEVVVPQEDVQQENGADSISVS